MPPPLSPGEPPQSGSSSREQGNDAVTTQHESTDAFGLACRDYHRHGRGATPLFVEFRSGGRFEQDVGHYFLSTGDWPEEEVRLLAHARGRVLDVGVGVGQYSIELQSSSRVSSVTGIDYSRTCLDIARRRGLHDLLLHDVTDGEIPNGPYDCFLLMGHNLALLDPSKGGAVVLDNISKAAAAGATILGTVGNTAFLPEEIRVPAERQSSVEGICSFQIRLAYGEVRSEWFDYSFASEKGLDAYCAGSGWRLVESSAYINGFCVRLEREAHSAAPQPHQAH